MLGDIPTFGGDAEEGLDAALVGGIEAPFADGVVEAGFGNGAGFDVADEAAVIAHETEVELFGGSIPLGTDEDPIAIAVGLGTGEDGMDQGGIESADALEEVGDLFVFPLELGGVIEVLVLATAAFAEVGAGGGDAFGGGLDDAGEEAAGVAFVDLGDLHLDDFAGADEGDEDDEFADPSDAIAAEGEVMDGEGDAFAVGERWDEGCGVGRSGRRGFHRFNGRGWRNYGRGCGVRSNGC